MLFTSWEHIFFLNPGKCKINPGNMYIFWYENVQYLITANIQSIDGIK
jgi:hypothetical protein